MNFPCPATVAAEVEKPDKEFLQFIEELNRKMIDAVYMRQSRSRADGITTYRFNCGDTLCEYNQNKVSAMLGLNGWTTTFEVMGSQHSPSVTVTLQPTVEVLHRAGIYNL